MISRTPLRSVPDTNVILASQRSHPNSPNAELIARWRQNEYTLLYSDDTLREYIEKLLELRVGKAVVRELVRILLKLAQRIEIEHYHERYYPNDPDDIAFLLCAVNGNATHIVSYDNHLLDLNHRYEFTICKPLDFLRTLRNVLESGEQ